MTDHARPARLVLADGTAFDGELFGAPLPPSGFVTGEVVFNTVMSGYQEVITDPSYAGQIITFTAPHIGNYGVNSADFEARRPFCRGVIVRAPSRRVSNYRAEASLDAMLQRYGIVGLGGLDTRRLTRRLRDAGSMNGAFGVADDATLAEAARAEPGTVGVDLVAEVSVDAPYEIAPAEGAPTGRTIVAYDFGIKQSMLRVLRRLGRVVVVPATTTAAEALALSPDGIFLSNGPGDPSAVTYAVDSVGELIGQVPIFGICLGHQLVARALGATTFKLPFGHHGGNHPVAHLATGKVEITSQNHGFCVDTESLPSGVEVTHVNLNDRTLEGFRVKDRPLFTVQYHPEAGPGPSDASYLFGMFASMIEDPEAYLAGRARSELPASFDTVDSGEVPVPELLIAPELGVA